MQQTMERRKNVLYGAALLLMTGVLVVACSKEQESPTINIQTDQKGVQKSGQYALFQVTNFSGLTAAERELIVKRQGYPDCPFGRVRLPGGIPGTPIYGFTEVLGSPNHLEVQGYCSIDASKCQFEQGVTSTTFGPLYQVIPNRTLTPPATTQYLEFQCKGGVIPVASTGSFFTYDAVANTWSASSDAENYFVYSFHGGRTSCPY